MRIEILYDELYYHLEHIIDSYKPLVEAYLVNPSNYDDEMRGHEESLESIFSEHIIVSFEEYIKYQCSRTIYNISSRKDLIGPSLLYLYLKNDKRGNKAGLDNILNKFYKFVDKLITTLYNLLESRRLQNKDIKIIIPSITLTHAEILEGQEFKDRLTGLKDVSVLNSIFDYTASGKSKKISTYMFCSYNGGDILS